MDNRIIVGGLSFEPYLSAQQIQAQVERVALEVRRDMEGKRPMFLVVLTGAFMFAADLVRHVGINDCDIAFIRYASYAGTSSTGKVRRLMGVPEEVKGRNVVIVEDIVDTGLTAERMIADLKALGPASVKFASLLYKPESSTTGYQPDYVAFSIPSRFIIGYGLDLDGAARNLPDIYVHNDN